MGGMKIKDRYTASGKRRKTQVFPKLPKFRVPKLPRFRIPKTSRRVDAAGPTGCGWLLVALPVGLGAICLAGCFFTSCLSMFAGMRGASAPRPVVPAVAPPTPVVAPAVAPPIPPGPVQSVAPEVHPDPWVGCPRWLTSHGRHRYVGPPALVPSWWTRTTLERARSCLYCDVVQIERVPTVIDMAFGDGLVAPLDHFVIEPEGGTPHEIALGSARRHVEHRPRAGLATATNGHDVGMVVPTSSDGFVFLATTADGRRITHSAVLHLPRTEPVWRDHWYDPAIAASPDRFAIAIGHSDGAVWFEIDHRGRILAGPVRLRGLGGAHPQIVWTGERFAILAEQRAGEGFGAHPTPAVWFVNAAEPSVDRIAQLPRDADERHWIVSGEFLFEHDAMFLAAKGWSTRSPDRFEVFRIGRDRTLASRPCADFDEE